MWLSITHFHNVGHILLLYSKSPSPFLFPLISLFYLLPVVPFLSTSLSFPSPALPPLIELGDWGSAVSSPSRSGRSPAAKCNLVNSGRRNERFLTCQRGKLQCSLNSLIDLYVFYSVTVWTVPVVSSQMWYSLMWVSKTPIPTWFWSFQRRFPLLKK